MIQLDLFECKRQTAHILFGILILWGIHFNILNTLVLGLISLVVLILLYSIKKGYSIPLFSFVLSYFERKEYMMKYPGSGLFSFIFSAFLSVFFFEKTIAMAALSILVIGDAMTTLVGIHLGKNKNPLNKDKSIEGTIAGFISSLCVCFLFVPLVPSLVTSFVGMLVEIPKIYIYKVPIDDNLIIPLSAGFTLSLF